MDAKAWYNKGMTSAKLEKYQDAIFCFDTSIKINPNDANAWHNKGTTLGNMGKIDEAIFCLEKAINLYPEFASAWRAKGTYLLAAGKEHQLIEQCFNEAARIEGQSKQM